MEIQLLVDGAINSIFHNIGSYVLSAAFLYLAKSSSGIIDVLNKNIEHKVSQLEFAKDQQTDNSIKETVIDGIKFAEQTLLKELPNAVKTSQIPIIEKIISPDYRKDIATEYIKSHLNEIIGVETDMSTQQFIKTKTEALLPDALKQFPELFKKSSELISNTKYFLDKLKKS